MKYYMISKTGSFVCSGKPHPLLRQVLKEDGFRKCSKKEYLKKRKWQQKEDVKVAKENK